MRKFKCFLLLLCCIISINVKSQGLSNIWLSGYASWGGLPFGGTVLDFKTGSINVNYKYIPMNFSTGVATISDSLGNIKLYTNGIWVAGANDDTIVNGGGISPPVVQDSLGLWVGQCSMFLQKPNDSNIYFLIHSSVDNPNNYNFTNYVWYSVIDMNLNNGFGGIISKNNILFNGQIMLGAINACKHGNGRDWWITAVERYTNKFFCAILTPYGIINLPKISVPSFHNQSGSGNAFSRDGTKYAGVFLGDSIHKFNIHLYDFDRCNGILSNERNIESIDSVGYARGIAFSPNGQYLYVATVYKVFQYDLSQVNIKNSEIIVAEWDSFYSPSPPFATLYEWMSLAPDGKIYINTGNSTLHMHIIDQPDSPGTACNFIQHGLQLPTKSVSAPPNHPNYFLGANGLCNNLSYESLESWKVKKVTVFGNPTHDKFTLWFPVDKDVGWLEIYDVNGECIRTERVAQWSQYKTVDISELSAGVYFCKMRWPSGEGSVKVVRLE
ncbi:MAG: T9SS type A sorting domain-containing protein [Bacteroidetes bacterium]|nr:T9SS type A sorting domain-containing protein [Bacteroidota bacterium]